MGAGDRDSNKLGGSNNSTSKALVKRKWKLGAWMRPLYLRAWCTVTSLKGAEGHFLWSFWRLLTHLTFFHQQTICFPLQNKSYLVPVQLWKVGFLYWARLQLINQSKREKENTKCIRTKCDLQTWFQIMCATWMKTECNHLQSYCVDQLKLTCCCSNIHLQSHVKQSGEPCTQLVLWMTETFIWRNFH